MILMRWNFADEIIDVPESYRLLDRQVPEADYVDLVSAAHHLLKRSSHDAPLSEESWAEAPFFKRLGMDVNMEPWQLEKLTEQVEAVRGVFA